MLQEQTPSQTGGNLVIDWAVKIERQCVRGNWDIIGKKFIQNNEGILIIIMENKKVIWKYYYKRLLNVKNAYDKEGLLHTDPIVGWNLHGGATAEVFG